MNQQQAAIKIFGFCSSVVFVLLTAALMIGAARMNWSVRPSAVPAGVISDFTYEIEGGGRKTLTLPGSLGGLAPRTPVSMYADVEPGRYESLLVKTVYTSLRLYADDVLIYECGQDGSYPAWLLDPPTLLRIVPLPERASRLRFEYISPSQRATMSVPALMGGTDGALLSRLYTDGSALFALSLLFLLIGSAVLVLSLIYWRGSNAFLHFGLFAIAAGCWSLGECDLTAFLIPYPALLYVLAMGGLFTLIIPFLRYGLFVLNPRNALPIRLSATVSGVGVIVAFALQLSGVAALSKTLPVFQILDVLGFAVFAATAFWEYFRHRSNNARRLVWPSLLLVAAALLEYANYRLRFIHMLSLPFLAGAFIFTVWLGVIGIHQAALSRREIEKKAGELAAEKAALERLDKMKADLIATVTHETMTPLAVLSVYSELVAKALRDKGVDEQTAKDLDAISDETQRIKRLMDELQNHTREKENSLLKTRLNLTELAENTAMLYTPILARKNIRLALRFAGDLPDVYACASEVTQVFFNLLQNAREAAEGGEVVIAAGAGGDFVSVTVSDTGSGVPVALLPRVFERGVSGSEGGTGLGLWICKEIIEVHGGSIDMESKPGEGTTVRFTLPVWKGNAK